MIGHCGVVACQRRAVFGVAQLHHAAAADVHRQAVAAALDVDPAPDDLARPADALEGRSAAREVHRRLPFTGGAGVAADEVRRRGGTRDLEDPDELVDAVVRDRCTPADVVQRVRGVDAEVGPDPVGDQRVDAGAFVDFVEMRHGAADEEDRAVGPGDRRAVGVVQQPFGEVGGDAEVLEPLLVLDADGAAAGLRCQLHRGVIHA